MLMNSLLVVLLLALYGLFPIGYILFRIYDAEDPLGMLRVNEKITSKLALRSFDHWLLWLSVYDKDCRCGRCRFSRATTWTWWVLWLWPFWFKVLSSSVDRALEEENRRP